MTLDVETQAGLFAAAAAAAEALRRRAPEETMALAGISYVLSTVAPDFAELAEWQRASGLPVIEKADYLEAVDCARRYAAMAFAGRPVETQH